MCLQLCDSTKRRQSLLRQPQDWVSQRKMLQRLRVARLQTNSTVYQRRRRGWRVRLQMQLQLMVEHMRAWVLGQQQLLRQSLNEAL